MGVCYPEPMEPLLQIITFVFILTGAVTNAGDKFPVTATSSAVADEIAKDPKRYELEDKRQSAAVSFA